MIKHEDMTDEAMYERANALFNYVRSRFLCMVDDDFESNDSFENCKAEQAYSLLLRQKLFGIEGKLIEGDMLPCDFEDIRQMADLELICFGEHQLIQSIADAAQGRLSIVINEGHKLSEIYDLSDLDDHNLESSKALTLSQLACLANLSIASVRNAISAGNSGLIVDKKGKELLIETKSAIQWLEGRNDYKPTMNYYSLSSDSKVIYSVPIASDGTPFSYKCKLKKGGFKIGAKGQEVTKESFDEALDELSKMPHAKWRRPNINGNYGIVSAVRWAEVSAEEIEKE